MTPRRTRPALQARSRSKTVVVAAVAVITVWLLLDGGSRSAVAQILPRPTSSTATTTTTLPKTTSTTIAPGGEWQGSHWAAPTKDGDTVADGNFRGTFVHRPSPPAIDRVDLTITYAEGYAHAPSCGAAPGPYAEHAPSTPTTTPAGAPDDSSTMSFDFEVGFRCNGLYDVTATATLEPPADVSQHDLTLTSLRVAVPPQPPASLVATDNGSRTVTVKWDPPSDQPPDLVGYRVARRATAAGSPVEVLGDIGPEGRSFDDVTLGEGGGTYYYGVQTLRSSPVGVLTSDAVLTAAPLTIAGANRGGGGGGSVSGVPTTADPGSGGTGVQHFDDTLAADEGELGAGDPLANVPGGDTVQRFVGGEEGSGLVKPSAVALNIAVWAALLLFLTRRAARAERADRLAIQLEHTA
jgi:hypothetical protein